MPTHTDEETSIVTKVSGPPILGVGHKVMKILLEGIVVERLEGRSIVKVGAVGIAGGVVLAEDVELDSIGPPGEGVLADVCGKGKQLYGEGKGSMQKKESECSS